MSWRHSVWDAGDECVYHAAVVHRLLFSAPS